VFALQSPSMADESFYPQCDDPGVGCQTGVEVAGPQGECHEAGSSYASTIVCVDNDGDFVYVKDNKADGAAALGAITSQNEATSFRICRNNNGNGTWARCNFDWNESGKHWAEGGVRDSSGSLKLGQLWSWTGK
jgi:hypothetical protein